MVGSIIQIFNRAPFPLICTKGGRDYPIPVGLSHITSDLLRYAKNQNIVPGTEDPNTLITESLISVVAPPGQRQPESEPLDPIPLDVLMAMPKERLDRNLLDLAAQAASTQHMASFPTRRVGIETPTPSMIDPGAQGLGGGND